jgi:hypothetical protein
MHKVGIYKDSIMQTFSKQCNHKAKMQIMDIILYQEF